jgi:transitional endoplasmic reticulum ATPase
MGGVRQGTETGVNERVLTTLLNEIDGVETAAGQIVFLAATNRPEIIDPALLRPGRLDRLIYIPLPDLAGVIAILHISSKGIPLASDVDF